MRLLEASNICFSYGAKPVLHDVSLTLEQGTVLFLLGPNGCGKTTLQGCILGFNNPYSGAITLEGRPIQSYRSRQFAEVVSYVPQLHTKTFPYKVSEIVLMGRTISHGAFSSPDTLDERLAQEALEKVGLGGFEDRRYTELSGGELRLVLIARALCQNARIMILDEPTAHLDFKHEINVLDILTELIKDAGLTVLIASHSLNHPFYFENEGIDTRVAMMDRGRILRTGRPGEVCSSENLYDVYGIESRIKSHNEGGKNHHYVLTWKAKEREEVH